ncbi:SLAM family member 9 isoform X2 [Periophthalmus magnuspinnatus]|uniref:SLAM family member 9 isoform X2 n=1 Tax=Periophthalmus magnuspinnatus TaxID=409849 RepID=UPI0024363725|nr:SLAM family member 9 isoform X2 [Periophthalmus magnuspinnatus]
MLAMPLLLLHLVFFMEINAVEETRYGLEGQSVCLDPRGQPPFDSAKWSHEDENIISNNNINPEFEKKINYYESNYTLCIKTLAKEDNGIYTFSHEVKFKNIHNKYRLKVQAAVPKPALNVTLEQVNSSTGVCIFTVNCSVQYNTKIHRLQSECNKDGCQSAYKTFSHINITISSENGTLTCTSNNHVSSKEDSRVIEEFSTCDTKSTTGAA